MTKIKCPVNFQNKQAHGCVGVRQTNNIWQSRLIRITCCRFYDDAELAAKRQLVVQR